MYTAVRAYVYDAWWTYCWNHYLQQCHFRYVSLYVAFLHSHLGFPFLLNHFRPTTFLRFAREPTKFSSPLGLRIGPNIHASGLGSFSCPSQRSVALSECRNVKTLKGWVRPVWPWALWSVTIWHQWAWRVRVIVFNPLNSIGHETYRNFKPHKPKKLVNWQAAIRLIQPKGHQNHPAHTWCLTTKARWTQEHGTTVQGSSAFKALIKDI